MQNNVAVLLSYYNGSRFIEEQLISLNQQIDVNVDIYIRDDGSPDPEDSNKLTKLCEYYRNVYVIKADNLGVVASFYSLLAIADNYDYYCFCDQDDFWYEDKILKATSTLATTLKPALYCSSYDLADEKLDLLSLTAPHQVPSFNNAVFKNFCVGCTCVINKELRNELINQYFNLNIPMHDWWFLLVAYIKGEVFYDPNPSLKYRQHDSNVVGGVSTFTSKFKRFIVHCFSNDSIRSDMIKHLLERSNKESDNDYVRLLKELIASKKSFILRLKFLSKHKFTYYSKLDSLAAYIAILLGLF